MKGKFIVNGTTYTTVSITERNGKILITGVDASDMPFTVLCDDCGQVERSGYNPHAKTNNGKLSSKGDY